MAPELGDQGVHSLPPHTAMLARGVPVVTVSERLGHARASTTLNVYAHSVPGADRDAADVVARLLRESDAKSSVMS